MATGVRLAGFMFHDVGDDPTSSGFQVPGAEPYRHTREAFAHCLDAIASAATAPVLVSETNVAQPGRRILLTFDDGGKSAMAAAELLSRRGWRGHFFIVTSLIGDRTFLDAADIRALRAAGHLVGSHSHTHPHIFRDLGLQDMIGEWRTSCDVLAQLLGEPILAASVPGGDIDARALTAADRAGVRYLFTSEPWLAPRRVGQCWILGRFSVKATTAPKQLRRLARFRGWTAPLVRRRVKVWATLALPWLYRGYVRAQNLGKSRGSPPAA
jgi:peptidoglycan/xylan/chitin deacetylase (PgdA/CDA1 family)